MRSLRRRIRSLEERGWHGDMLVKAYGQYREEGVLPRNKNLAKHILDIANRIDALLYADGQNFFEEIEE